MCFDKKNYYILSCRDDFILIVNVININFNKIIFIFKNYKKSLNLKK